MTTETLDAEQFTENMVKATGTYQKVLAALVERQATDDTAQVFLGPLGTFQAFSELAAHWFSDPEKLVKYQLGFYENYFKVMENSLKRFMGEPGEPLYKPSVRDNRFRDKAWEENALFDFIKQSYLLSAEWLQTMVQDAQGMDAKTALRVDFFTRQLVDALAPSNFFHTNPVAWKETLRTGGENIRHGLENLLKDLERCKGQALTIQSANETAFAVGKNLAVTPGKVVFQNDLMQLIHYEPLHQTHYQRPVLVIPAWINKYYIVDLQPKNSFVRWLLEQGYAVFAISWVNPGAALAHKNFEDYLVEGPLAALDAIEKATGEKEITAIGYCLGGTLLACTLAYLKAKKDSRIKAATFLTTMLDFSECGEISVFIDDEHIESFEARMGEKGYLEGSDLALTFNMLRANDMIWSFVVNNYLLGKDPFPFDLLYWNSDTTRLPAAMHSFYLRNMYQRNLLAKPNGITLKDVPIDLGKITIPCYFLSTKEDHIAPWKATFAGTSLLQGDNRFVLSGSGHVAGVINHPEKNKYCYWVGGETTNTPEQWFAKAKEHEGSWWIDWNLWNAKHSGEKIVSLQPGKGKLPALEEAPGSYVKVK